MRSITRELVRRRARDSCEYCHIPQQATPIIPFHVEHVLAKPHGGTDDPQELALACDRCNAYKGPNLTSVDPETGDLVPLFHPRRDNWDDHFGFRGGEVESRGLDDLRAWSSTFPCHIPSPTLPPTRHATRTVPTHPSIGGGETAARSPRQLNAGMSVGNPTLMKNRAKAWDMCSRYGGRRRRRPRWFRAIVPWVAFHFRLPRSTGRQPEGSTMNPR